MASKEFTNRPGSIWERTSFEGKTFPEVRAEMEEKICKELRSYEDVSWSAGECGTLSGKWIRPQKESEKVLYYVHGGGFTTGSSGIPMPFLLELAHRLQINSFSADYRLAPEHTFPAAPEDAFAGYKGLLEAGYKPENIVLCGESAGATLVLDIGHLCKEQNVPQPAGIVAMSPVTDAVGVVNDTVLEGLQPPDELFEMYAPGWDKADRLISPALGDVSGFPPVALFVGSTEVLLRDSLVFTETAAKAAVDVRLHVGQDMIHTYPLDLWDYPEAMEAFEEITLFVAQRLGRNCLTKQHNTNK